MRGGHANFDGSLRGAGPYTINLTAALPDITSDMTINGPGAKVLTVKRNAGIFRIFFIHNGATASISGWLQPTASGGGIGVGDPGWQPGDAYQSCRHRQHLCHWWWRHLRKATAAH
jgi:hypothetical protein